jgi:hypothetical protein
MGPQNLRVVPKIQTSFLGLETLGVSWRRNFSLGRKVFLALINFFAHTRACENVRGMDREKSGEVSLVYQAFGSLPAFIRLSAFLS